jgi:hypothetical protein
VRLGLLITTAALVTGCALLGNFNPAATAEVPRAEPGRDFRFVPISGLTLGADHRTLTIDFVGGKPFSPDDPCSKEYRATATVQDGVLEVGVSQVPRGGEQPCDAMGYGRSLVLRLDAPFAGTAWRDRYGYLHFLAPPPGLVELTGLPQGWALRNQRDVEESPAGRWERTYSPDPTITSGTSTVVLYQSFGGPVNVTGGDAGTSVELNGRTGILYRWPPSGELVLVWRLGANDLALVANEREFSVEQLIKLAESARAPDS